MTAGVGAFRSGARGASGRRRVSSPFVLPSDSVNVMTPSTDWKEVLTEGEAALHERLAETVRALQRENADGGRIQRALHAKPNASFAATFTVLPDLPAHAKQGLFASPGTYEALVRFSNGSGRAQTDARPDVRGIGVKVLGVEGPKAIPALAHAKTQDFHAIRDPTMPFRVTTDFVWLLEAMKSPALLPLKLMLRFGPVQGVSLLRRMMKALSRPMLSCATTTYFMPLPVRFGTHAAKLRFVPAQQDVPGATASKDAEALRDDLHARVRSGPVAWEVQAQFFVDETRTPIEDPTKEWTDADAPPVRVGRLEIPVQDATSPRGVQLAEWVETLSFDPWHALEAHRPLGEMMRARNVIYRVSTAARNAAPEPERIAFGEDDMPARAGEGIR